MVIKMKRGELCDVTALVSRCRIVALRVMTSSLVVVVVVMTSLLLCLTVASRDVGLCRTVTCPVITRQKPKVSRQSVCVCVCVHNNNNDKKLSCCKETVRLLRVTVTAKYNSKTIFCEHYRSIFNHCDVINLQSYRIL